MVTREMSLAIVNEELPPADAYALRHGWVLRWHAEELFLLAETFHPANGDPFRLRADLDNYKAQPPVWRSIVPGSLDVVGKFPAAGPPLPGMASIFHTQRLICAPFSRLAFKEYGGPHQDWNGDGNWLQVRGNVTATTLAEMIAQITVHLARSPGWMS